MRRILVAYMLLRFWASTIADVLLSISSSGKQEKDFQSRHPFAFFIESTMDEYVLG